MELFPVLKSNAYGHGIKQIATILKKRKTTYLVVDSYYEALQVQEVNSSDILLIGYTLPKNFASMDFSRVTPTIYDIDSLQALGKLGKKIRFHLKIDTGMSRQGVTLSDLPAFLEALR